MLAVAPKLLARSCLIEGKKQLIDHQRLSVRTFYKRFLISDSEVSNFALSIPVCPHSQVFSTANMALSTMNRATGLLQRPAAGVFSPRPALPPRTKTIMRFREENDVSPCIGSACIVSAQYCRCSTCCRAPNNSMTDILLLFSPSSPFLLHCRAKPTRCPSSTLPSTATCRSPPATPMLMLSTSPQRLQSAGLT